MCGDPLAAAGESHTLRGGGLDIHLLFADLQIGGEVAAHRRHMRRELGSLRDHGDVHVAYAQRFFMQQGRHLAQQDAAVDVFVVFAAVGEMTADIAERRGAQQRIAQGMDQHIAVGMGEQTLIMGNGDAAQYQGTARAEAMGIVAVADPQHARSCCCKYNSANARS